MSTENAAAGQGFRLVLGSKSKGRQACLRQAGYKFDVRPADIDEKAVTIGEGERDAADPTKVRGTRWSSQR